MSAGSSLRRWAKSRAGLLGSVVRTTSPHVVLTYDDGPDPEHTPRVLEELARHGASATFFVLLTRTRRLASLVQEMAAVGHEIALHGPDHRPLVEFGYAEAGRRTADAKRELEDLVGQPVRWFRPPYGAQSLLTWRAVRAQGLTPVLWSASTWDWKDVAQAERVQRSLGQARAGSILLAHDAFAGVGDGVPEARPPDVDRGELARLILEGYQEQGLSAVSLETALRTSAPVLEASFSRRISAS